MVLLFRDREEARNTLLRMRYYKKIKKKLLARRARATAVFNFRGKERRDL